MVVLGPNITVAAPSAFTVWQEYRRSGDPRLRDRLIFTLAPLVRHAGAATSEDAATGLGAVIRAVDRFAPERHGALEQYAWAQIRAALVAR
jgi:RNA polymerase sigma factor for flagellar operon FliA